VVVGWGGLGVWWGGFGVGVKKQAGMHFSHENKRNKKKSAQSQVGGKTPLREDPTEKKKKKTLLVIRRKAGKGRRH